MSDQFEKDISKCDLSLQNMLRKAWVTASMGYVSHICNIDFNNIELVYMINNNGLTTHDKRIEWKSSTYGIGKLLRDQTYKCIKESIYPSMKVLSEKGEVTIRLASLEWLVNTDRIFLIGSEYFTNDGFECIVEQNAIIGFSWKYATKGYAYTLRQISELGFLNTYLPFLKVEFEENPHKSVEINSELLNQKFTPRMIEYLKEKENIYLDNNRFYKKFINHTSYPTTSVESEPDQNLTNDSTQLRSTETDKS